MRENFGTLFARLLGVFFGIHGLMRGFVGVVFRGKLVAIAVSLQVMALQRPLARRTRAVRIPPFHLPPRQFSAENWLRCNTEFSVSERWP